MEARGQGESFSESALTLSLSQRERGHTVSALTLSLSQRERGHTVSALTLSLSQRERGHTVSALTLSLSQRERGLFLHFAFLLFFMASVALPTVAASGMPSPPEIQFIQVGFAGCYKAGAWTQVEVALRGGDEVFDGELVVIAPDGDGVPVRATVPCRLAPGEQSSMRLITRIGRVRGELTVEFRIAGRTLARKVFTAAGKTGENTFPPALEFRKLIVVMGETSMGADEAARLGGTEAATRPVVVRLDSIRELPTDWLAYEGVDAVLLSTARPEMYAEAKPDDQRLAALRQWVRMGGRLAISAGERALETLSAGGPLGQFLPGRIEAVVPLRQTGELESYCGSRSSVFQAAGGRGMIRVPRLLQARGAIEAQEADLPLVVRVAEGFGQIVFLAADLDAPPLAQWTDRGLLTAKLLDLPPADAVEPHSAAAMRHFGYEDMAGQLRGALDHYAGVSATPFWLAAVLIAVYILLIGPGDYFFLRRVVGRMQWTWLSFSLLVAGACIGAWMLANHLKGNRLHVNQIDLVEVDAEALRLRGAAWLSVFSPRTESFALSLAPRLPDGKSAADARSWFAWLGLSGSGLGGMNPRNREPSQWTEPFAYSPDHGALLGVPIGVWSSRGFTARWQAPCAVFPAAELAVGDDQLLRGEIRNTLDFALEKCVLIHGRSAYELGTLPPGGAAELGAMSRRSDLKTFLTGQKALLGEGDKFQQEATPYNQASLEPVYVLRAMMFYQAAGGRRYTGLWLDNQDFVDLSSLLKTGRAILVAEAPADANAAPRPGATLLGNGKPLDQAQTEHRVVYRFIYPVNAEH
jgi:hypothetical protein